MTQSQLYDKLNYVDASRENRSRHAEMVLADPKLMEHLLEILFKTDDEISCRAAWILEFVTTKKLSLIYPYLEKFTDKLQTIKFESALRPAAKICENLVTTYYDKTKIYQKLNEIQKQKITEFCFDLMIGDHKVAPKAYSMQTLSLLSQDYDWIKKELIMIIEKDYTNQSAGYKARARRVLNQLKN